MYASKQKPAASWTEHLSINYLTKLSPERQIKSQLWLQSPHATLQHTNYLRQDSSTPNTASTNYVSLSSQIINYDLSFFHLVLDYVFKDLNHVVCLQNDWGNYERHIY